MYDVDVAATLGNTLTSAKSLSATLLVRHLETMDFAKLSGELTIRIKLDEHFHFWRNNGSACNLEPWGNKVGRQLGKIGKGRTFTIYARHSYLGQQFYRGFLGGRIGDDKDLVNCDRDEPLWLSARQLFPEGVPAEITEAPLAKIPTTALKGLVELLDMIQLQKSFSGDRLIKKQLRHSKDHVCSADSGTTLSPIELVIRPDSSLWISADVEGASQTGVGIKRCLAGSRVDFSVSEFQTSGTL